MTRSVFCLQSLVEVGTRSHIAERNNLTLSSKPTANNNNNVGRVASWAVTFENLLQDRDGVAAFTVSTVREGEEGVV